MYIPFWLIAIGVFWWFASSDYRSGERDFFEDIVDAFKGILVLALILGVLLGIVLACIWAYQKGHVKKLENFFFIFIFGLGASTFGGSLLYLVGLYSITGFRLILAKLSGTPAPDWSLKPYGKTKEQLKEKDERKRLAKLGAMRQKIEDERIQNLKLEWMRERPWFWRFDNSKRRMLASNLYYNIACLLVNPCIPWVGGLTFITTSVAFISLFDTIQRDKNVPLVVSIIGSLICFCLTLVYLRLRFQLKVLHSAT